MFQLTTSILAFVLTFFISLPTIADASSSSLEIDSRVTVEVASSLIDHLDRLPENEQLEQIRDWMVFSLLNHAEINEEDLYEAVYDYSPLRQEFKRTIIDYWYGESRSVGLKNGELYILVPTNNPKNKVFIARACDDYRMNHRKRPERILVLEYQIDRQNREVGSFVLREELSSQQAFSADYGYYESGINTVAEAADLLARIDDVTYLQDRGESVLVGGRKFADFPTRGIVLEDLAALYQADNNLAEEFRNRVAKRGLQLEYENWVAEMVEYNKMRFPLYTRSEIEKGFREQYDYTYYYQERMQDFMEQDLNIGFSLDPDLQEDRFSADLKRILVEDDVEFFQDWFDEFQRDQIVSHFLLSLNKLQEEDQRLAANTSSRLLGENESSFNSFLAARSERVENMEYQELISRLQKRYDISDEQIAKQVDKYSKETLAAIQDHRDILIEIADSIAVGRELPFYRYKTYLSGLLPFELVPSPQPKHNYYSLELSILEPYIVQDLIDILRYRDYEIEGSITHYDMRLGTIVQKFQQQYDLPQQNGYLDATTFRLLLNLHPDKKQQFNRLRSFLFDWQQSHSYQRARYDGYLQGTEVGMTLFYTDLVMKIWSFNYENTAPKSQVPGFEAMTTRQIDLTYYEELQKLSGTRSWLGDLPAGYIVDKNELHFTHCATRIFNASSSDLFPGHEVEANFQSYRFADWWNNNYSRVADYDQEYHRLNQIMKWSIIVHWLKAKNRLPALDRQRVNRSHDFRDWYKERNMVVKADVPFLDSRALEEETECMQMINSKPHFPFTKLDMTYRFSGGVSLASRNKIVRSMRLKKTPAIAESGFTRGGIDYVYTSSPREIKFHDGRTLITKPEQKLTTFLPESKQYRGSEAELYNYTFSKKIQPADNQLSIIETGGDKKLFSLDISSSPKRVSWSYEPGELQTAQRLLKEMESSSGRAAFSSDVVRQAYHLPAEKAYYIQLRANDQWVKVTTETGKSGQADIRVGKNITAATDQVQYYKASFTDRASLTTDATNYTWIEGRVDNTGSIQTRFSRRAPAADSRTLQLYQEGKGTTELKVSDGIIKVKNDLSADGHALSALEAVKGRSQGEAFEVFTGGMRNEAGTAKLSYSKDGKVLGITAGKISEADMSLFRQLIPKPDGQVRRLLLRENSEIKFIGDDILQMPRSPNPEQLRTARQVIEMANKDASWVKEVWKGVDRITAADLVKLQQIDPAHTHLRKTYYQFKAVDNLSNDVVVADLNAVAGEMPQIMVLQRAGTPEIINLNKQLTVGAQRGGKRLQNLLDGKTYLSQQELLESTQSIADGINKVIEVTGGSRKTIVTTHTEGINTALVSKLHKIDPRYKVIKDQPDIERSARNAEALIYADMESTVFLSTIPFEKSPDDSVSTLVSDLYDLGMQRQTELTAEQLKLVLRQKKFQQLILVVRANDDGLIMSDGMLPYDELSSWIESSGSDKEALYLISNRTEKLQQYFAATGRFTFVAGSTYQPGNLQSLRLAFLNLRDFWQQFSSSMLTLHAKDFKKLQKKLGKQFPQLGQLLQQKAQQLGSKVVVTLNGITKTQRELLSRQGAQDLFRKYTGQSFQMKDFRSAIDEVQQQKLQEIDLQDLQKKIQVDKIRSIPDLKCDIKGAHNYRKYC